MVLRFRFTAASAALCAAATAIGCGDSALPGTALGTYAMTGSLSSNTCGAGLNAPNPWTFDIQLSEDSMTIYYGDGNANDAPLTAPLPASGSSSVTFTNVVTANVDGTSMMLGPCNMQGEETIDLTLGSGMPPESVAETFTETFSVLGASDCGDQLSVNGGMYDTLPCTYSYSLTGTKQ